MRGGVKVNAHLRRRLLPAKIVCCSSTLQSRLVARHDKKLHQCLQITITGGTLKMGENRMVRRFRHRPDKSHTQCPESWCLKNAFLEFIWGRLAEDGSHSTRGSRKNEGKCQCSWVGIADLSPKTSKTAFLAFLTLFQTNYLVQASYWAHPNLFQRTWGGTACRLPGAGWKKKKQT